MKRSQQAALIRQVEAEAAGNPAALQRRVVGLALVGYAFFVALVLGLLAAAAAAVYLVTNANARVAGVKLLLPLGAAIWACASALFVRFPPVEGMPLRRTEAPRLFALLDALRDRLRTPTLHHVLITSDVNASVTQRPKLGWFGWYRNTVTIGWPLIEGLSPQELEAVLAHEIGHLSRAHGRLSAWGYRVRATFARLAEHFEKQESLLDKPMKSFLGWWWPKLEANTFVLSRWQELEADRAAADFAGGHNIVNALLRTAAIDESLPRFWRPLFASAESGAAMPGDAFHQLGRFVRSLDAEGARQRLRSVAAAATDFDDTHPALKDRAGHLGIALPAEPSLAPIAESAAAHFFEAHGDRIRARLQEQWESAARAHWQGYGEYLSSRRKRLAELEARPADALTVAEAWERSELLQALGRQAEALTCAAAVLEREPQHAQALLLVGRERLERGEERGRLDLAEAARLSPAVRGEALAALVSHERQAGREAQAREAEAHLLSFQDDLQAAAEERQYLETDPLEPHRLSPSDVAAWLAALRAAVPELTEVRFARKKLRHFADDQPVYVVGFRVKIPWYRQTSTLTGKALQRLAQVPLPGSVYFVSLDVAKHARERFGELAEARVHPV